MKKSRNLFNVPHSSTVKLHTDNDIVATLGNSAGSLQLTLPSVGSSPFAACFQQFWNGDHEDGFWF